MIRRLLSTFSPEQVPYLSRPSYRREVVSAACLPTALALVEGGVAGVVAKKVFDAHPAHLAVITGARMFANLTSFLWARLGAGRRKPPWIAGLQGSVATVVAAVALLPVSPLGAWLLTGLVVVARCLMAGVVTLRSTVWRMNYPRELRARITGRFAMLTSAGLFLWPALASVCFDASPTSFRLVYPVGGAVAIVAAVAFAGVRLRGERSLLRAEREAPAASGGAGRSVLRGDPHFRSYLGWQFLAGMSNMMVEPAVIDLVSVRTEPLRRDFLVSIAVTQAVPMLLMLLSIGIWARHLDRVHVSRFRVSQGACWVGSQLLLFLGAVGTGSLTLSLLVLGLSRAVLGVARGGGVLAWNLGHNDFAARSAVPAYMGTHVTLTGIRGCFAPFLGMFLYKGWPAASVGFVALPAFEGMGGHVFLVAATLSTTATVGFFTLQRSLAREGAFPAKPRAGS